MISLLNYIMAPPNSSISNTGIDEKSIIRNNNIEIGSEYNIHSIVGDIFECYIMIPLNPNNKSNLIKCKYLLAITDTQIIEMYPHTNKKDIIVTADIHGLQGLQKLKFKKGNDLGLGMLLLEYKSGKISKLLMESPGTCVECIKNKMNHIGMHGCIKSKHEIEKENAQSYFKFAEELETLFTLSPSIEYISDMMDLLRKSAEKFGEANDESYIEVMSFIKSFLKRGDVLQILDDNVKKSGNENSNHHTVITTTTTTTTNNNSNITLESLNNNEFKITKIPNELNKIVSLEQSLSDNSINPHVNQKHDIDLYIAKAQEIDELMYEAMELNTIKNNIIYQPEELNEEGIEEQSNEKSNSHIDDYYNCYDCNDDHLLQFSFHKSENENIIDEYEELSPIVHNNNNSNKEVDLDLMLKNMSDEFDMLINSFQQNDQSNEDISIEIDHYDYYSNNNDNHHDNSKDLSNTDIRYENIYEANEDIEECEAVYD